MREPANRRVLFYLPLGEGAPLGADEGGTPWCAQLRRKAELKSVFFFEHKMLKGPHQSKIVSCEPIFASFPQGKLLVRLHRCGKSLYIKEKTP